MKQILKKHPIITSLALGVLLTIVMFAVSILSGRHYYYRIYNYGDTITDAQIQTVSLENEPIHLLDQTTVEYGEDYTLINFNTVHSGEGSLQVSYNRHNIHGDTIEMLNSTNVIVLPFHVALGEGIYNHNGISVLHLGIVLYAFLMILYFIWRRKIILETSMYSYEYMSTWSGQVFFTCVFIIYILAALASLILLKYVDVLILSTITRYLFLAMTALTFPVVFIFSLSMTISNLSLIRHEGKRLTNMLGIFTGLGLFAMIIGILVLFILFILQGRFNAFIAITYSIANAFYMIFYSVLSAAIISGLKAGHLNPVMNKDYIIILGCAIKEDGTLYPLIQARVDRAIAFWKEQFQQTGKKAIFVPSGGQGSDECISEGEAMKRYLLEQGIEEECILAETNSTTTLENMKFSKELIQAINPEANIAFSTTNYHVMRSGILANQAGLKAEGMGAPTKWYFWPNALLREVVGMFAYQPKVQILTMLTLSILAGITGYLYFLIF